MNEWKGKGENLDFTDIDNKTDRVCMYNPYNPLLLSRDITTSRCLLLHGILDINCLMCTLKVSVDLNYIYYFENKNEI